MKKLFVAIIAGLVFAAPLASVAAPDETQRQIIRKAQDAKKLLGVAQAASGMERQKKMQEHTKMMQDMTAQMQKAKPADGMSPTQMREWIDEHLKLMSDTMEQMMEQHHMTGHGMQGMGKK